MKASQLRAFQDVGVVAGVMLGGGKDFLEVDENGILVIPKGVKPAGFHLVVAVKKDGRTFVVQKVVGTEGGAYDSAALSEFEGFARGFRATVMRDPIDVLTAGSNTWTGWHRNTASNRVDCWYLAEDGKLDLFQVGIFTHDNGVTWKLHGEYRWRGQLYQMNGSLVGRPESKKWGSLEGGTSRRTQIFQHPGFVSLLDGIKALPIWDGDEAEIDPPLPEVPERGQAVVQWYIVFAGQGGQGPANLHMSDGTTAWIHAADIVGRVPDEDGEIRLWRGDIVSFTGMVQNWGSKKNGPPKLTGVKLVSRAS